MSQDIYNAAQVVASDKAGQERTPEQQAVVTKARSQIR